MHHRMGLSIVGFMVPAGALFLVGLVDDLRGLRAIVKLFAQIAGGTALYFAGFRFVCFRPFAESSYVSAAFCFVMTVGCVVLVCNSINLIDGLDGLAAGAALFSMVTIFTFALVHGRHGSALAVTILAGANLGFLVFNFNPASIFLGDSGSLFIGFSLSALVMSESSSQSDPFRSILVPVLAFALPLTDLSLTVVRRYLSGHSIFGADREHIHHKLLELGLSQRQVIAILYSASALSVVLSLALIHPSKLTAVPVFGILVLVLFFGIRRLNYHEFGEVERLATRFRIQKQVAASSIAIRKSAARLEEANTASEIVAVLESCLRNDFDAFKIVLDPGHWVTFLTADAPTRILEKSWSLVADDRIVVTMDLVIPHHGRIGQLSLQRDASQRLLVDSWTLQRELRHSLTLALQNCMITMPTDLSNEETMAMMHGV